MKVRLLSLCMMLVGLSFLSACERPQDGVFTPPKIEQATLDNGLRLFVFPDHRAPIVMQMLWYNVGGADENPGESGLAHLFEHLMFRETDTLKRDELSEVIERMGGENNAFTGPDFTAYHQYVPRSGLETIISMEASRMCHLRLSDRDIELERKIVLEERLIRVDSQPVALLFEKMDAELFTSHPYSIPLIGWRKEIEAVAPDKIRAFYQAHYAPDNAILVLAGDITLADATILAERYYGDCPARGLTRKARPSVTSIKAKTPIIHTPTEAHEPFWARAYRLPKQTPETLGEYAALDILLTILGGAQTSRFAESLVYQEDALAYDVSIQNDPHRLDYGFAAIIARPTDEAHYERLAKIIDAEILRLKTGFVTPRELALTKAQNIAQTIYGLDDNRQIAQAYGAALSLGFDIDDINDWEKTIQKVTRLDVMRAANKYLNKEESVTGYIKSPTPPAPNIQN